MKQIIAIFIILSLFSSLYAKEVYAEEGIIDNNAQVENDVHQLTSEPTPEPTPQSEGNINNHAEIENNISSNADSGDNSIILSESTEEASSSANVDSQIQTGDAASVVSVETSVNSTEINSTVVTQTLNIDESGDLDLTAPSLSDDEDQNINVVVVEASNSAHVINDISSLANSGQNSITAEDSAEISTGDAYSTVTLVNLVNTNFVDSTIYIYTINIYGSLDGDIILPEFSTASSCCSSITQVDNSAVVINDVSSEAISGQNSAEASSSASISTGAATSDVDLVNLVNQNFQGVTFYYLFVNTFGSWSGDFLGWDDILRMEGGGDISLTVIDFSNQVGLDCSCELETSVTNQAYVVNQVSSTAQTGGNSIYANGGSISTGDAYSVVSILNFINSTIVDSVGFFGFINIFGELTGDIGGESFFPPDDTDDESQDNPDDKIIEEISDDPEPPQQDDPYQQEQGGQLEITQSNNVGEYVLPGDTVTFFVRVKNSGTGKVYDAKLRIGLIKDGVDMGGVTINLGDIEAGKGLRVSTGLVLSEDAKPGVYTARAKVWGYVGPDNREVSSFADSSFTIFIPTTESRSSRSLLGAILGEAEAAAPPLATGQVVIDEIGLTGKQIVQLILAFCTASFAMIKTLRGRKRLNYLFMKSKIFLKTKSLALRSYF